MTQKYRGVHRLTQLVSDRYVSYPVHPISLDAHGKWQGCLARSASLMFLAMSLDASGH